MNLKLGIQTKINLKIIPTKPDKVEYLDSWDKNINISDSIWIQTLIHNTKSYTPKTIKIYEHDILVYTKRFQNGVVVRFDKPNQQIVLNIHPGVTNNSNIKSHAFHNYLFQDYNKVMVQYMGTAILTFEDIIQTVFYFEIVSNTDLLSAIEEKKYDSFNLIIKAVYQICNAVDCVHKTDSIRRNIKLENFIITLDLDIKLSDFEYFYNVVNNNELYAIKHVEITTIEDDWYDVGCILFSLLTGFYSLSQLWFITEDLFNKSMNHFLRPVISQHNAGDKENELYDIIIDLLSIKFRKDKSKIINPKNIMKRVEYLYVNLSQN
jgi:serine/threonine protein kinase